MVGVVGVVGVVDVVGVVGVVACGRGWLVGLVWRVGWWVGGLAGLCELAWRVCVVRFGLVWRGLVARVAW